MELKVKRFKNAQSNYIRLYQAIFLIFLVGVSTGYYFLNQTPIKPKKDKLTHVVAEPAMMMDFSQSIDALGVALANESIDISSNEVGKITKLNFADGQSVKKGEVIIILDQQEEQAKLASVKAILSNNGRELNRLKTLLLRHVVSQQLYDERRSQFEIALQEVNQIQAKIDRKTIRAPFDGVLGIRKLSEGATVLPGQVIATIDDITSIKLDFNIPSIYLSEVSEGLTVKAETEAIANKTFKGTIKSISSRIDPSTSTISLRAMIENGDLEIKPGLLMKINLISSTSKALVVPEESVIQRSNRNFVYVIDTATSRVNMRNVKLGARTLGYVEITSGLQEGEVVVQRGVMNLYEGKKVVVDNKEQPANSIIN